MTSNEYLIKNDLYEWIEVEIAKHSANLNIKRPVLNRVHSVVVELYDSDPIEEGLNLANLGEFDPIAVKLTNTISAVMHGQPYIARKGNKNRLCVDYKLVDKTKMKKGAIKHPSF